MTTTEHATRRPVRRIESTPSPTAEPAGAGSFPMAVAAHEVDHPGQLETLCVGEAR